MTKGRGIKLGFHSAHTNVHKEIEHTWYMRQAYTYQCQNCGHEVDVIKGHPHFCYEKPEVDKVIEE